MSKLIHILKIEMASPKGNPFVLVTPAMDCVMNYDTRFEEIHAEGLIEVSVEDSFEDNQRVYATTATFRTCRKAPLLARQKVFRLTAMDGTRWLMGTGEKPYPIVSEANPWPGDPSGSALKKVKLTWKATTPLLRIIN